MIAMAINPSWGEILSVKYIKGIIEYTYENGVN